MWLFIDCYDSFSYSLVDMLTYHQNDIKVIAHDEDIIKAILELHPERIILSPGPGHPNDYPHLFEVLERFSDIPILGVCLGHQIIGMHFGMTCIASGHPLHGKTSKLKLCMPKHPIMENIREGEADVMHYHSLITLPSSNKAVEIIATDHIGQVMIIAHNMLPIIGIQFHPESIQTNCGLALIENWVNMYKDLT